MVPVVALALLMLQGLPGALLAELLGWSSLWLLVLLEVWQQRRQLPVVVVDWLVLLVVRWQGRQLPVVLQAG